MGHEQQSFRLPADLARRFHEKAKRLGVKKVEVFRMLVQEWTDSGGPDTGRAPTRLTTGGSEE